MRLAPVLCLLAVVCALGCGSTPTQPNDFTLSAAPSAITMQSGGSARTLSVTVGSVGKFNSPVTVSLSGLPSGVTATPATLTLAPGQLGQFQLSPANSPSVGTDTITVTGTASAASHTASAALTITAQPVPDFTLSAAPDSVSLTGGGSSRLLSITVAAVNGFSDPVSVSLSGLPAGVTATPSTLSVTPGQIGQFQLSAASTVTASTATITATGTADSLSHTATASLTTSAAVVPDFTLTAAPSTLTLPIGGSARSLSVTPGSVNGFADPVTVSLSGLPAGVTATPASLTLTPGQLGQFQLTASSSAAATTSASITVTGSADSLSHTATAGLTLAAGLSNASLSASSFDFGTSVVGTTLTKSVVTVTNTGIAAITLSPTISGDPSYSIASGSCGATLAAGASCSESVSYAPTTASGSSAQTATLSLGLGNVPAGTAQTVSLTGVSAAQPQGTVASTNNPQVALYTVTLPAPGSVTVNFGTDTTYGHQTWTQSTAQAGGTVSIYVAGMLANTTYHMQAVIQLQNGTTITGPDQTFTTGTPLLTLPLTATTTPGMTPQSGVELVTPIGATKGIVVTDLQGNTLWSYVLPNADTVDNIEGVKLLPNGDFVLTSTNGTTTANSEDFEAIREIDLAGNIVRELTVDDLNNELQTKAATNPSFALPNPIQTFHHDITPLPNGHWLVLTNTTESFQNLTGYPGTTIVTGDVVIDLDQNLQPVWLWNEFDHLDVNRHPMQFPDWTHSNAIVYTPDDHNILVSIRHQNWVVKVDYEDGAGSGNILWKLGYQGDFTLQGGSDPQDWQYAQHGPAIVGPTSAGVFNLVMMDNGDDRVMADGNLCGTGSEAACYTTVPEFQIDETAKTATLTFHQILPVADYSYFGGNAEPMANGDLEYDLCGLVGTNSDVVEVTPDAANPTTVWQMQLTGNYAYRAFRMPSLYPGVQW